MSLKRTGVAGLATMILFGAHLVSATGAAASPTATVSKDGWCDKGEVCLYYNSNLYGGMFDVNYNVLNYGADDFRCSLDGSGGRDICNGSGSNVWNNAASVRNNSGCDVVIYYNSGYKGAKQDILRHTWANLNATLKNNNASHQFIRC
ncbi:peptidase inhibitor family I36 protein [Streptomyces sp. NPDC047434]|uniref:peptidase inhibitor family I36 protein n=1 Tax=Streptomyces sp. NPDC047434 TaxID=3155143 RepID=UPI0034020AC4